SVELAMSDTMRMGGNETIIRSMRAAAMALLLAACGDDSTAAAPDAPPITMPDAGACPALMSLVNGQFCVDQYGGALGEQGTDGSWHAASPYLPVGTRTVRAVPAASIVPQGYISGAEAATACAASGKRLCSSTEWLAACRGPQNLTWP